MVKPIILNKRNVIPDDYKNRYVYQFPNGMVHLKSAKIALARLQMWNSINNITDTFHNNMFNIKLPNGNDLVTPYIKIPDGQYTLEQMNVFIQYVCIQNNFYLITDSGDYAYFIELVFNPTQDRVELVCYVVPTLVLLPAGWSAPGGFPFPASPMTPQLDLSTSGDYAGFAKYLGFTPALYPPTPSAVDYNVLADEADSIYAMESLVVNCNLVNNSLSIPATQLYSFSISDVPFGAVANESPTAEFSYVKVNDGIYTSLQITLTDEFGNNIFIRDTDIVIVLSIDSE
jgi:hypothetical protein